MTIIFEEVSAELQAQPPAPTPERTPAASAQRPDRDQQREAFERERALFEERLARLCDG